ncbi:hypothetical protein [Streptomyces sp. NPDC059783]|uniref:hypothetical protein n=1 Tax=Streptomyces sp. NPDC059783 TaxID=3346944 RepID=UPI0036643FDA
MTACAIEDEVAEAVGPAGAEGPAPGAPETAGETAEPAGDAAGPARDAGTDPDANRDENVDRDPASPPPAPAPAPAPAAAPAPAPAPAPAETVLPVLALSADGAYGARLTTARPAGGGPDSGGEPAWFAERWTLDGPEPYAVPLPLDQPEEADSQVLPLADGRVLIHRRVAGHRAFSLLYPTGPGTGELPLGIVECEELTLLPPSPDGVSAYALAPGTYSTALWRIAGAAGGPEHLADLPGHCTGGVWLDRAGRMLALDREPAGGGPVKAVAVDLGRDAEMTPLLQIAPESNDRLLLADPDSGLLLIRSDAPGHDRIGWGVLGSCLPVRFPECLRLPDAAVTPFAVQPGQALMPESCAVALRIDGAAGTWLGVWRPSGRRLHQRPAPFGWLAGSGVWSADGVLALPYADAETGCAVALLDAPSDEAPSGPSGGTGNGTQPSAAGRGLTVCRPVPLGQAPLVGRMASH